MVNLFQVSSAYGRAMETLDRVAMSKALYPAVLKAKADGSLNAEKIDCAIASCAEGYSFPTNLDRDPPIGGLAPKPQAVLFREALAAGMALSDFNALLDAHAAKRLS